MRLANARDLAPYTDLKGQKKSTQWLFVEGLRMVETALESQLYQAELAVVSESFLEEAPVLVQSLERRLPDGVDLLILRDTQFKSYSETKTPQGIALIYPLPNSHWQTQHLLKLLAHTEFRALYLERVQDPGNMGTLLRTAEALGFDALFYSSDSANPWRAKALRSAMGSSFHLPLFEVDSSIALLQLLKQSKVISIAASLHGVPLDTFLDAKPELNRFCLLLGNEASGLAEETCLVADKAVRLAMYGRAESYNVAVAGGILAYALRQLG